MRKTKTARPKPQAKTKPKAKPKYTAKQIAALQAHALKLYRADHDHAQELGHALIDVRVALRGKHGAFKKWWQSHKLSQARVSYCMRLANGKFDAAKQKLMKRSPFNGANAALIQRMTKTIHEFGYYCDKANGHKPEEIFIKAVSVVGSLLLTAGRIQDWTLVHEPHSPLGSRASATLTKALIGMFNTLFAGGESGLDPVTWNGSDYLPTDVPKKPPQSEVAQQKEEAHA